MVTQLDKQGGGVYSVRLVQGSGFSCSQCAVSVGSSVQALIMVVGWAGLWWTFSVHAVGDPIWTKREDLAISMSLTWACNLDKARGRYSGLVKGAQHIVLGNCG